MTGHLEVVYMLRNCLIWVFLAIVAIATISIFGVLVIVYAVLGLMILLV